MTVSVTEKDQTQIDIANSAFWDELCGSQLAAVLGITDNSPESLKRFDDWYMDYYPYLYDHIPFHDFAKKKVLEVGLGYGTVSQKIIESGADFCGLDIAAGPVAMANLRLAYCQGMGQAIQGSVLAPALAEASFDYAVAIGSLHHTGALQDALKAIHALLKPGGGATVMVYSANSYRQWKAAPLRTLKRSLADPTSYGNENEAAEVVRGAYDSSREGTAAPQTEFVTAAELRWLARDFSSFNVRAENVGAEGLFRFFKRSILCRTLGRSLGLDLYCHLKK